MMSAVVGTRARARARRKLLLLSLLQVVELSVASASVALCRPASLDDLPLCASRTRMSTAAQWGRVDPAAAATSLGLTIPLAIFFSALVLFIGWRTAPFQAKPLFQARPMTSVAAVQGRL